MWLCMGVIPTGPDHMQAFMESEGITESFKRAVLTRPIYSQKKEGTCMYMYVRWETFKGEYFHEFLYLRATHESFLHQTWTCPSPYICYTSIIIHVQLI